MFRPPAVLLVQAEEGARARTAADLRQDGMEVIEFAVAEQAKDARSQRLDRAAKAEAPDNPVDAT